MRALIATSLLAAFAIPAYAQTVPKTSGGANLGSAQLYAAVDSDGTLLDARSKGTTPCLGTGGKCRTSAGAYEVNFARDVTQCAYTVTAGGVTPNIMLNAYATAGMIFGKPNTVWIGTKNAAGTSSDAPFYVVVLC